MHSTRRSVVYVVTNDPIPNGNAVLTYLNDGAGNLSPLPGSPFKTNGTGYTTKHDIFDDGSLQPVPGSPFPSGGKNPVSIGLAGDKLYVVKAPCW